MNRRYNRIRINRWLCIPLGLIMFYFTSESFGMIVGMLLGIAAMVSFWMLMNRELARIIGESIITEIKDAILEIGKLDSVIEIKKIRSGLIARVYLINGREKVAAVHRSIDAKLNQSRFKNYIWAMQLTDIPGRGALAETRNLLNEQLLDELLKKKADQQRNKREK